MAKRWTFEEESQKRSELSALYVEQNKTITEIGKILSIKESTVFDRMKRLQIPSTPERKVHYNNKRQDIIVPTKPSGKLAKFVGILLGDGHIAPTQVIVTLNHRERNYLEYISNLMQELFGVTARYYKRENKSACDLYIGSVELVGFFKKMGLVSNKVQAQVKIPNWVWSNREYMKGFVKGFFDTDGSIYKLKFGVQMNFCNRSFPLLNSTRIILLELGYHPSEISNYKIYLTRKPELIRYAQEVGFGNTKHFERANQFGIV